MRPLWYILDKDKNPVPAKDATQANLLLSDTEARRVALDKISLEDYGVTVTISTVFLVLDHSHSPRSKPVLFESMIFNGDETQSMIRYCTWKEAVKGHKQMVELAKNNIWVGRILDKISADISNTKAVTEKIIEGLKSELFYN